MQTKTTAIIVAAGSGSRLGSQQPKQFVQIAGQQVLEHTLGRFQAASSIDEIILVLSSEYLDKAESFNFTKLKKIVAGGDSRAASVFNGLSAIDGEDGIVAVHDGARPLVSVDEIDRTIEKARQAGAACLTAPVTDTIKSIRGGEIASTLDREVLRRALTPQAFELRLLRRAFTETKIGPEVTDECYLVEKLGHPIAVVDGSPRNIKITHSEDLLVAEAILKSE